MWDKTVTENSPLWHPLHFSVYLGFSVSFLYVETRRGAVIQLLTSAERQTCSSERVRRGCPWRTVEGERGRSLKSKKKRGPLLLGPRLWASNLQNCVSNPNKSSTTSIFFSIHTCRGLGYKHTALWHVLGLFKIEHWIDQCHARPCSRTNYQ